MPLLVLARASAAAGLPAAPAVARALPLALPDASHTRLVLQDEGIAWLRALRGPVALVSIIGPYRSGKSFLLNRLLDVDCDAGFAVGHRRQTQTKGVWLWSAPLPRPSVGGARALDIDPGAEPPTILLLDTEGIEGAGATGVYDDRIFSFAALVSSVLVYNVPEAVREGDIEKLAFVVELAAEFWSRIGRGGAPAVGAGGDDGGTGGGEGARSPPVWAPPSLLWLIQRDFLQGAEASEHVAATLRPVPNPSGDEHVARLNQIRSSLSVFANVAGIGVPQPTLERTRLCELAAARQLPSAYVDRLGQTLAYIHTHATPRRFGAAGGGALADFAERALSALNAQEIPSVASVVATFNAQLVARVARAHAAALAQLALPLSDDALRDAHDALLRDARARLLAQSFGGNQSAAELDALAHGAFAARRDANFKASHVACAAGWARCEPLLGVLRAALLPSRRRLDDLLGRCNASLASCAGPAATEYMQRAADAADSARRDVLGQFDQKLSSVCIFAALALVIGARFALRSAMLEAAGWAALFLLEVAPRLDLLGGGTDRHSRLLPADSARARAALGAYEAAVYNPYYDLDSLLAYIPFLVIGVLVVRFALARRRRALARARTPARTPGDERRERERRERGGDAGAVGAYCGGGSSGGGGAGHECAPEPRVYGCSGVVIKSD